MLGEFGEVLMVYIITDLTLWAKNWFKVKVLWQKKKTNGGYQTKKKTLWKKGQIKI